MILVLGDILIDKFSMNKYVKKSPEANVPIVKTEKTITRLGGAANLINNINSLNKNCFLVSRIGNKTVDRTIVKMLKEKKIKHKLFIQENFSVGKKSRFYLNNKQIFRIDNEKNDKLVKIIENKIIQYIKKNIKNYSLLVISDYNKGLINQDTFKKITRLFIKEKKTIITNPKKKNLNFYKGSNIIVPNEKEFNNFFSNKISFKNKVNKFFLDKNLKHLIITRGKKKLIHMHNNKKSLYKIKKVKTVDVTGASDTFLALLSLCISKKISIHKSIKLSIMSATKVVEKQFTSIITKKEYIKFQKIL